MQGLEWSSPYAADLAYVLLRRRVRALCQLEEQLWVAIRICFAEDSDNDNPSEIGRNLCTWAETRHTGMPGGEYWYTRMDQLTNLDLAQLAVDATIS